MNRATFMMQLRRGLAGLPQNEIEDICADYRSEERRVGKEC